MRKAMEQKVKSAFSSLLLIAMTGLLILLPCSRSYAEAEDEENPYGPGWNAIAEAFEKLYPDDQDYMLSVPIIPHALGGEDPLDAIAIFDGGDYWQFVTFGLTELNEKTSDDPDVSGFGYEMTLRLKKYDFEDEQMELRVTADILQTIASFTFEDGDLFTPYDMIYTGQTNGLDSKGESKLTGFICVPDPYVEALDTPNGRVEFVELIGVTDAELRECMILIGDDYISVGEKIENLYKSLGTDLTDYRRDSLY